MTEPNDALLAVLREIRDDQKKILELTISRFEEVHRINAKAEAIQDKSARIVGTVQKFVPLALIAVTILIVYLSWLLFRVTR
jgi:hypothetical protein